MSKMWKKKGEIIRLLEKKPMTVSGISERLGLAVSTTSQHVAELRELGAIEEMDIGHAKKWRYYRINPNFDASEITGEARRGGAVDRRVALGGAFAAIAVAAVLVIALAIAQPSDNALLFSLTDPPTVPAGTTSLVINYSSLETHVINGNSSSWVAGDGGGTANLLDLVNSSQIIGLTRIPSKGVVDAVRFNINSATVVINGTTYNISVPNSQVTAEIVPPAALNGTGQVLIDLFPTVSAVYNNSSTSFVLLLTVKAITQQQSVRPVRGIVARLSPSQIYDFRDIPHGIALGAVHIAQGNQSNVSIEVVNELNRSVLVKHVILVGSIGVTVSGNASGMPPLPPPIAGPAEQGAPPMQEGVAIRRNASAAAYYFQISGSGAGGPRMVDFIVNTNGTMQVQDQFMQEFNTGYILAGNSNATFTFKGNIILGNGSIRMAFVPGAVYRVLVIGNQNAYASNDSANGN